MPFARSGFFRAAVAAWGTAVGDAVPVVSAEGAGAAVGEAVGAADSALAETAADRVTPVTDRTRNAAADTVVRLRLCWYRPGTRCIATPSVDHERRV